MVEEENTRGEESHEFEDECSSTEPSGANLLLAETGNALDHDRRQGLGAVTSTNALDARLNEPLDAKSVSGLVSQRFPALAAHQFNKEGSNRARLVRLLNECVIAGYFPRMKGDRMRIAQSHFARKLGVIPSVVRMHLDIITSYEAILEEVDPLAAHVERPMGDAELGKWEAARKIASEVSSRFPELAIHQSYTPGSTKAKLVGLLNDCILAGSFPRSSDIKQINRTHFAGLLDVVFGVSYKEIFLSYDAVLEAVEPHETVVRPVRTEPSEPMDANALDVVARFPELLKHQHCNRTARKLVDILNAQLCGGGLLKSRDGKISRTRVANELGIHSSALTAHIAILTDYEDATGGREARIELMLPEMRAWFERSFSDGTLQIWNGKASRVQFYAAFNLHTTQTIFTRYPDVGALVTEFDDKIAATGYLPGGDDLQAQALEKLLKDRPPLTRSGRKINKREIFRLLDLTAFKLKSPPFSTLIEEAEKRLLASLDTDPLTASVGGRVFKFHALVEYGFPASYAARVAKCFERTYRAKHKNLGKTHHHLILALLSFIAGNGSQICRSVFHGLGNGVPVASLIGEFTRALEEYRDHLREIYDNDGSCNQKITSSNAVIRALSADSVLPVPSLYMRGFQENTTNHFKTVAEASDAGVAKSGIPSVDDYIVFATSMLRQAADSREIELAPTETGDFTKVLREELEADTFTAADNPANVILRVLDRRISLIRAAAWAKAEEGRRDIEYGHSLLARAVDLGEEDYEHLLGRSEMNERERKLLLRQYFPVDDNKEQGIANLLRLVKMKHGSLYPAAGRGGDNAFYVKRSNEYGGSIQLQSYLIPSAEVVSACLTLYLLDSGSNIAVGRTLFLDCIEATEEPHHSKVTGRKAKAAGKPIFAILEDRSEAIRALTWIVKARADFPAIDRDIQNQLFICKGGGQRGMIMLEEYTYRSFFKALIKSIPELAHLAMTPNMLRPSILLKAALGSDGRTKVSLAMGDHGVQVHEGYVNRYPLRYLRDSEIRHFQHSLETVVIRAIEEAHSVLGVDADGMARRIESVMRTGLGTLCANRNGRPGNEGSPCQAVDCWNDCPQLIVIAKKEEIAILQIWQHSLRLVEGDWIRDQPERWEAVWLPWLCFIDAVEVKLRAKFNSVWKAASGISEKMISSPNFEPMRLF